MTGAYLPLAGVRVLDFGRLVPAAQTTFLLASMGADVVKVERPGDGDPIRVLQADEGRPFHEAMDRGKRSIALDLRRDDDREVALALTRAADVVVDNSVGGRRAGVLDLAALRMQRPALVVCTITGFGLTGPYADVAAHGLTMDATAAVLGIEWHEDEPAIVSTPCSWANELGSTTAALAITAALLEARTSGQGAWIDLSCTDAAVVVHRGTLRRLAANPTPEPAVPGAPRHRGAMFATYRCADGGVVMLATLERKYWDAFCDGIGRPDLRPRYAGRNMAFAAERDDVVTAELRGVFASAPAAEWQAWFTTWGIPGGRVLTAADLLDHPHVVARGLVQGDGRDRYVATAIRWHSTDERAGAGLPPAPELDQDRADVLRSWLARDPA